MEKDSDISAKEEKPSKLHKLSFNIPNGSKSRHQSTIPKEPNKKKFDLEIKRGPKKSAKEYLEILRKLDILLNQPLLSEAKRNDYCKSQRYFMKLYLKFLEDNKKR
jgi:hypothetical protein